MELISYNILIRIWIIVIVFALPLFTIVTLGHTTNKYLYIYIYRTLFIVYNSKSKANMIKNGPNTTASIYYRYIILTGPLHMSVSVHTAGPCSPLALQSCLSVKLSKFSTFTYRSGTYNIQVVLVLHNYLLIEIYIKHNNSL